MCEEGGSCKCNLPAKVTFCVGLVIFLIGAILYAIGAIQAAGLANESVIIDGESTFSLPLQSSEYFAGYTFFSLPASDCYTHSGEVETQIQGQLATYYTYLSTCGWSRGRFNHGGRDLISIGAFAPYDGAGDGTSISFSLSYRTWVVDASVDTAQINDAFALIGLTMAGFLGIAIGVITCSVACCLMCCMNDKTTTVIQQVPQQQGGTAMVVGQPVAGQPVMAQPVMAQPCPA